MNKKRLTYLMVAVVAFIWGKIVWDLIDFKGDDQNNTVVVEREWSAPEEMVNAEKYEMKKGYADPFLKNSRPERISSARAASQSSNPREPRQKVAMKLEPVTPPQPWPEIKYLGRTRNITMNQEIAVISVDGNQSVVRLNEQVDQYQLTAMYADSIVVKRGEELKTFALWRD